MKRSFFTLLSFLLLVSVSCKKDCRPRMQRVDITFDEATESVTFSGEQGQGSFSFYPGSHTRWVPATGTYGVCITWGGGCGAYRLSNDSANLVMVGPAGGTSCIDSVTLVTKYNAWTTCE